MILLDGEGRVVYLSHICNLFSSVWKTDTRRGRRHQPGGSPQNHPPPCVRVLMELPPGPLHTNHAKDIAKTVPEGPETALIHSQASVGEQPGQPACLYTLRTISLLSL